MSLDNTLCKIPPMPQVKKPAEEDTSPISVREFKYWFKGFYSNMPTAIYLSDIDRIADMVKRIQE